MKRFFAPVVLMSAVQAATMMASCDRAEPVNTGTGGAAIWECFTPCGVIALVGFDSCEEVAAAYCSTGGQGGAANAACDGTLVEDEACGSCEVSPQEYCSKHDCAMPALRDACRGSPRSVTRRGCGFLSVERPVGWTAEPPSSRSVWDEETGELLFHSERSVDVSTCEPTLLVGELPECVNWSVECDTGYACVGPPHIECLGCAPGCLDRDRFASCAEMDAAAGCGATGGGGGQGGFGGSAP